MLTACINKNFNGGAGGTKEPFDHGKLRRVRVEYFDSDDPVVPIGTGLLLVPLNTDVAALERMLTLWSLGSIREEASETCQENF